ncbi:glycoside hydrolase family 31 protein [Dothidotthia symphoricarpi CBS 119687]|uniref:alpha-glucosidase n=1 Tax=Dothidotthia symphoricarpi CBS 119687 TaxID=1392245 RepID=A0A6A6AC13_9PLEO|nr:glycoside hydrolase family 31 protein [Dothidotthia symphoricarpi CBS 119687]KAF2128438.1 glycoside hydrolase family 31 protein [Dothidotthia symphoricarpi CBS 119687]
MAKPARYEFKTRPVAHTDAIVAGDKYRFTILTDGLLRFEWAEDGVFEDRASTFAINRKLAVPDFYVWDRGQGIEIVTKRFHVVYDKKKFSAEGFRITLKGAVTGSWSYAQKVSNLGGTTRTLDGVNGRANVGPGVLSREGIAVLDDSKSMLFEKNGWIAGRSGGERSDEYIFMYGRDYREAIRAYYAVSGSQPLLPRYAMGNWWSRYHAYDEKEYLELHDHFEKDDVPMNVAVVDMDWHLVWDLPDNINGWTGYTWNKKLFPDPDAFMKKLHDRGMKLTLNLHPADGIRHHEDQYAEVAKYMGVDPKSQQAIPFDCTDKKFMDAYFDVVHHQHEERGVDFWWVDWQQGNQSKIPGVDPLWVLNHFHFLDSGRGQQRPLILSRFGGPGAQRYQIGFSGDAIITWDSLHFQPEFTATASNIGYGWWSNDIGGHTHGYKDDELYTRWVQLGCYSPILRLHSDNNPFNTREPWRFTEEARLIVEDTLRFRHRLIPYLYTMNARSASDDEPLIQPMYWDHPEVDEAYTVPNQFRFGSELIVAPITQPRDQTTHLGATKAWLPAGRYVDIFTGIVYNRKGELRIHRPLDLVPVLAPEGAIVPLDGAWRPKSGSPNPESLEILLVVGADGSFTPIEDNGTGTSVDDGGFHMICDDDAESASSDETVRFSYTPIVYKQTTGVLKIGPTAPTDPSIPSSRTWKIRLVAHTPRADTQIRCITTSPSTKRHAKPLPFSTARDATGTLVTLGPVPADHTCILEFGAAPQLDVVDPNVRIWEVIDRAWIDMDRKWDVWNCVNNGEPVLNKVRALQNRGLKAELLDALLELLLADERYGGKDVDDVDFE